MAQRAATKPSGGNVLGYLRSGRGAEWLEWAEPGEDGADEIRAGVGVGSRTNHGDTGRTPASAPGEMGSQQRAGRG